VASRDIAHKSKKFEREFDFLMSYVDTMKNSYIIYCAMALFLLGACKNPTGPTSPISPTYEITYDGNGATSGKAPVDNTQTGGAVTIRGNTGRLERRGWSFIGWARTQEATAAKYRAGATLKITENLTLYAVWRSEGYTISFDKNHAGARAAQASQRAVFGTSVPLPATTTFIRPPEMKFEGWAESSTGAKIQGTYNPRNYWSTITLYAKWVRKIIAGNKPWASIAMSDNGQELAAVVNGRHIYTSSNSGDSWTNRSTTADSGIGGNKTWYSIAMSGNGKKLAAVVNGGHIYTSSNSGATWTNRSTAAGSEIAGNRNWRSIAMSDDGQKLAAGGVQRAAISIATLMRGLIGRTAVGKSPEHRRAIVYRRWNFGSSNTQAYRLSVILLAPSRC